MIGFLGLGSNVGDRRAHLQAAVDLLAVDVLASSSVYATEPMGEVTDQPEFLNACLRIETELGPEALLDACKAVERERGRTLAGEPGYVRHGPRPLDVDLLLLGDTVYESDRLTLPAPRDQQPPLRARAAARARPRRSRSRGGDGRGTCWTRSAMSVR